MIVIVITFLLADHLRVEYLPLDPEQVATVEKCTAISFSAVTSWNLLPANQDKRIVRWRCADARRGIEIPA